MESVMQTGQDNKAGILKRLYAALNEFDKALDYDPLDEVLVRVQRLEKEMSAIKQSLPNK
jgi:hypothetical protein